MMAIINILYGSFYINNVCNDPNDAGSCSTMVNALIIYDAFGLVYLGLNIVINLIDAQQLDGYILCFLTFRRNTREECWHFGFGVIYALITPVMCFIILVTFVMYIAEYCYKKY
jgi:hypothetical protein